MEEFSFESAWPHGPEHPTNTRLNRVSNRDFPRLTGAVFVADGGLTL